MDMEDVGRRRSVRSSTSVIASGSVWESRMKTDEVKGGIKVFNGDDNVGEKETGTGSVRRSSIGVSSRRKTWKSETNFGGFERSKTSPIQVSKVRSDSQRPSSSDTEKSPVTVQGRRKLRSERSKELGRSLSLSGSVDDVGGGIGSPIRGRRKLRSDSVSDGVGVQSRMEKPEPEPEEGRNEAVSEPEKSCGSGGAEIENCGSDPVAEMEDEFGLCQEKAISCNNVSPVDDCDIAEEDDDNEEMEVEDDEFEETEGVEEEEKKNIDIKEMDVPEPEHKPEKVVLIDNEEEEVEEKPKKVVMAENEEEGEEEEEEEEKPKKVVIEEKKFLHHLNRKPATMASTVRRQPPPPSPVIRRSTIYQNLYHQQQQPTKPTPPPDQFKRFPHTQSKLQSLVDLVMWRDVSRSAFVFGLGTFVIISSSYTQDLNISFISVISYVGLVYLASIFLYKSIICRGVIDNEASYVVGEGEAVWLIKLFLPYLNEFLLKLRALFSGDPCTTMKLAVLLFVLARCGSSITIWKMAKFGFFGAFTVPKVCSSYSSQISAYGNFWIRRFEDAWESCTHKKAVAIGIFTLVWNLSSIVARVWAVFMVCVGIRYYQQSMMVRDDWVEEEQDDGDAVAAEEGEEASTCSQNGGSRGRPGNGVGPTIVESSKAKKGS